MPDLSSWSVDVPVKDVFLAEIGYVINFDGQEKLKKNPTSILAQLGCAYRRCEYVDVKEEYGDAKVLGWYTEPDGAGEQYFDSNGDPVKSVYAETCDITLYPKIGICGPSGVFINGVEANGKLASGRAGNGWQYSNFQLTLDGTATETLVISGTNHTEQFSIRFKGGASATFENLSLAMAASDFGGIVRLTDSTNVTITLVGTNNVLDASRGDNTAAIYCPYGCSLALVTEGANHPYAVNPGDYTNGITFAASPKFVLRASGGNGAAAIGGAGNTCGDLSFEGVAMVLSAGGPHLIGNGLEPNGGNSNRTGRIVFFNTLVRPDSDSEKDDARPVWPRPHDDNGRPMFKVVRSNEFFYLPTGLWKLDVAGSEGVKIFRVSFNYSENPE